jgi:hypothetical protein
MMGGKTIVRWRMLGILAVGLSLLVAAESPAAMAADSRAGKISGVVLDPAGVPQMGATIAISAQTFLSDSPIQLLSNARGQFSSPELRPGLYTVHVILAGFLPALLRNVQVNSRHITSLHVQLGSVFAGISGLERQPNQQPANDEWGWVLRSSAGTRPILRLRDGNLVLVGEEEGSNSEGMYAPRRSHGRIDVISGARPGTVNSFSDSPATSFAYDEGIGSVGQLLLAGQFSYESQAPSGGFATMWLPDGASKSGPMTSLVVRQSRLGPEGPIFRGMRFDQDGALPINDRVTVRYGAEYLLAGLGSAITTGFRPRGEIAVKVGRGWEASFLVASRPVPEASPEATAPLESALKSFDTFPTTMFREGRPVLENGWHEELAVEHLFRNHSRFILAGFHDDSDDTAVFGKGRGLSNIDFLQSYFGDGFAYDGGSSSSWGARAAYQREFSDKLSATLVYAWAGALTPSANAGGDASLREALNTQYHSSVAGSFTSHIPHLGTVVTTGYKWIGGPTVSRQDEFGETFYRLDPYFNLAVRQPIPCAFLHHMEAVADIGNLLAQGYVPITTRDGHVVLVAAYRTFRGGISLQF